MFGIIIIAVVLAKIYMNSPLPQPNVKPFTCLPCLSFWLAIILLSSVELLLNEFGTFVSIEDELNKATISFGAYALGLIFFKLKI